MEALSVSGIAPMMVPVFTVISLRWRDSDARSGDSGGNGQRTSVERTRCVRRLVGKPVERIG